MNKKLLTLAVAAALTAPTAAMAEAILYGKLHVSVDYTDVDSVLLTGVDGPIIGGRVNQDTGAVEAVPAYRGSQDYTGFSVNGNNNYVPRNQSRANRIGVKGSEDLGNGLKAVYQVEFGVQLADESQNNVASGGDAVSMRNSYVGLASGFGTVLVGRHDTPMKISTGPLDLFSDTLADFNGTVGFGDVRADNVIAYISPNWGGFQLAAAAVAGGGDTIGQGSNINSESIAEAYSIAGIYKNGPFYASMAYESIGTELYMNTGWSMSPSCLAWNAADPATYTCPASKVEDDYTKWRIGLGLLDWNGFTLTGIYEEQDGIPGSGGWNTWQYYDANGAAVGGLVVDGNGNDKLKIWQVQAGYSFGNSMVKAMYGSGNRDGRIGNGSLNNLGTTREAIEGDYYTWAIAFDHNFSKRTKAYVLYTEVADDDSYLDINGNRTGNGSWSGFSLGMVHSF
jgi:predicted porin